MARPDLRGSAHLTLDEPTSDPRLARRLPANLARRLRAVPLAEDSGRVTVAMADPDDEAARDVIASVLGSALCVVQVDPATIDSLVVEAWGDDAWCPLNLAVCTAADQPESEVVGYAQSLADLLGAQLTRWRLSDPSDTQGSFSAWGDQDLVILSESHLPLVRRLVPAGPKPGQTLRPAGMPPAVLIARQPRWPLAKILLLPCVGGSDEATMRWVMRLARASGGGVTVLAVVPPTPSTGRGRPGTDQGLSGLLTSETGVGRQIHTVARHLVNGAVQGTLRLRQGPPEGQIKQEVTSGEYDLIAMAAQPCQDWARWLEADLTSLLLRWTGMPILITGLVAT